ncbi:MAG: cupin domain-containing protein [Alphaproteobacteria bacterium]|nr:cupin domain-containing protein [Alphaproteobacteria bacterium]
MKLHADFSQRVVVQSENLPWIGSPLPGVDRRMLERDGEEVARATTIVRFAPNSAFAAHTHGGGEEYLVLDGVFSDKQGDFEKGMYVRNPPGSEHTPSSIEGCTILVKLRQMDPADQAQFAIDTTSADGWVAGPRPGVDVLPLHQFETESVRMLRFAPGARLEPHDHPGGEEIFVLEGSFEDEHGRYETGAWIRNPPGSRHEARSEEGCLLYVKTGHLG